MYFSLFLKIYLYKAKNPKKLFRKASYGQKKMLGKKKKKEKPKWHKPTPSFCDDEQIQAVCFIICSPMGRKLGTVFLELLIKKCWKMVINSFICKVLAYESRL